MNWYYNEKEAEFRSAQAIEAGKRKMMMREVKAMQAEQKREQRMALLAFLGTALRKLRRTPSGRDEQSTAEMTPAVRGAGHRGG